MGRSPIRQFVLSRVTMFQSGCEPGVAVAAARESGARERGESDQASKTTPSHVGLGTLAPFLASRHPHPHPRYKAVSSQRTAHTTHHASLRLASAHTFAHSSTPHTSSDTPRASFPNRRPQRTAHLSPHPRRGRPTPHAVVCSRTTRPLSHPGLLIRSVDLGPN